MKSATKRKPRTSKPPLESYRWSVRLMWWACQQTPALCEDLKKRIEGPNLMWRKAAKGIVRIDENGNLVSVERGRQ